MLDMIPGSSRTDDVFECTLAELTEVLNDIREKLLTFGGLRIPEGETGARVPTMVVAQSLIRERTARRSLPCGDMFIDPAWDMLLDLFVHRARGRGVSVTSACIAAGVPPTTAMRYLAAIEERGMIRRMADPRDRRRSFVSLSDSMANAIERHIATMTWG